MVAIQAAIGYNMNTCQGRESGAFYFSPARHTQIHIAVFVNKAPVLSEPRRDLGREAQDRRCGGFVVTSEWGRRPVQCSTCGKPLLRRLYRPKDSARIHHFFCDTQCKGSWQRAQREQLGFTREWLYQKYIVEKLDCTQIASIAERDPKQVWNWIRDYGIPTRPRGGLTCPHAFTKGQPNGFAGHHHSEETRQRLREIALADGRVPFDPAVGSYMKGKSGAETTNWKGGITPERQALYSSDEWVAAVKMVWARDNARCRRCGKHHNEAETRGTFHIHHIVSFMVAALRADPANLVLLCSACHRWVHSGKNTRREFITEACNHAC